MWNPPGNIGVYIQKDLDENMEKMEQSGGIKIHRDTDREWRRVDGYFKEKRLLDSYTI